MASTKETYCLCGQPYNIGQFMIECDCCREWFHGSCVDVKIYQSDDIDKYHCPKCAQTYGPSVLKIPTNNHRADRYELGAESRPSQTGSPAWVRALAARPPRPHPDAIIRMRPNLFTEEFVKNGGFVKPILFNTSEGLDIKVPNPATFSARSVLRYCGAQLEVEVIDVRKQTTLRMPLGEFVDYFETPPESRDEKVLNLISLEFSDTNMSPLVDPPYPVRQLDWSNSVWRGSAELAPRPSVSKYCLLSVSGAYTDWHLDFGGTSVWYRVLRGRKTFYLAPPTATNLALYQQWSSSNNQNERFFGDMLEWYGSIEVEAGHTLLIPSGWLHAVLTTKDSLVLGGNYLHSYAIETQLQMYEIERRVDTPLIYRYPLFEAMNWYAGAHLLTLLRRYNEESQDEDFILNDTDVQAPQMELPPLLLRGIKILANALKEWHALKSTDTSKRDNVPKCLNSGQLVRELCKELRTLEKRTTNANQKDKDFKAKTTISPKTHKKPAQKKPIKLTLPKPIMHMAQNGEYPEKQFFETKEPIYQDNRYIPQEVKFTENGLHDTKSFHIDEKQILVPEKAFYPGYDEAYPVYAQDGNGFVETHETKVGNSVLKIKFNSPSSSREAPPPYELPEHSILKSHLIGRPLPTERQPTLKPIQQWTISKKDIGEFQEQILFTNENLQTNLQPAEISYGPGMYSAEDIQPDYQYAEPKPGYRPDYSYEAMQRREQLTPYQQQAPEVYAIQMQEPNGYHQEQLPSYDAAMAQQYATTTEYVIEEAKPTILPVPRRSERCVRRRVSASFDYEDGDLYLDDVPPRQRRTKQKQREVSQNPSFRATRPTPSNGIESLIQASVLAEEEPTTATEHAAVAGMLSISEQRYPAPQRTFGLADNGTGNNGTGSNSSGNSGKTDSGTPSNKRQRKPPPPLSEEETEEDVIKEVHRDDEYVYPSLEMSSDEDEEWTSSRKSRGSRSRSDARSRSERDAAWSPRGRVGRLLPRAGNARDTGREAVRAALSHARETRRHNPTKRPVLIAKTKRPSPAAQTSPNKNNSRLKKGMKTAKQRLDPIVSDTGGNSRMYVDDKS